jgi:hypothetical protein
LRKNAPERPVHENPDNIDPDWSLVFFLMLKSYLSCKKYRCKIAHAKHRFRSSENRLKSAKKSRPTLSRFRTKLDRFGIPYLYRSK